MSWVKYTCGKRTYFWDSVSDRYTLVAPPAADALEAQEKSEQDGFSEEWATAEASDRCNSLQHGHQATEPAPEPAPLANTPEAAPDAGPRPDEVVAAVREMREVEPNIGIKKMVKELLSLYPDWAGHVDTKAVREAARQLGARATAEGKGEEPPRSGAPANNAAVVVGPALTGKQRKKVHNIICDVVSRAPKQRTTSPDNQLVHHATYERHSERAITTAVTSLDQAAPRDAWVREWASTVQVLCAKGQVADVAKFGLFSCDIAPLSSAPALAFELGVESLQQVLQVYSREANPVEWARAQATLGNAYRCRTIDTATGVVASDQEAAIRCYEEALQVETREAYPAQWFHTQVNLGLVYRDRINGDAASNAEVSIRYFERALEVGTREAKPHVWASLQAHLGDSHRFRAAGDAGLNTEEAIRYYEQALQAYSPPTEASAVPWATTWVKLGQAYQALLRGDIVAHREASIYCYKQAVKVNTRKARPEPWAQIQHHLGHAYNARISGDMGSNKEEAIRYFTRSLEVFTREAYPDGWAMTQLLVGTAYDARILGDAAFNKEEAISHFEQALELYERKDDRINCARARMHLGDAYRTRINGDRVTNKQKSIRFSMLALQVYSRDEYPEEWAQLQLNLGNAYRTPASDTPEDAFFDHTASIRCFVLALQVYTRVAYPELWALTQSNLGIAYMRHTEGNLTTNLEDSIRCLKQALHVYALRTKRAATWSGLYCSVHRNRDSEFSESVSDWSSHWILRTLYETLYGCGGEQVQTRDIPGRLGPNHVKCRQCVPSPENDIMNVANRMNAYSACIFFLHTGISLLHALSFYCIAL